MDIAIIRKNDGYIENVIVAESVEDVQRFYPDLLCIERSNLMLEPGGTYRNGVVTRAPVPQ